MNRTIVRRARFGRLLAGGAFAGVFGMVVAASGGPIPGTVAFVGLDHQLYGIAADGGEARPLTAAGEPGRMTGTAGLRRVAAEGGDSATGGMRFSGPSWSPDGKSLLVQGSRMSGEAVTGAGLYRVTLDRPGIVSPLFEDLRRPPIYAFWDPTGRSAAVLVSDGQEVALALLDVAAGASRTIGSGLPFYFAWRADGKALLAHVGGSARENREAQLSVLELPTDGPPKVQSVDESPAGFRAPSWSPDGRRFAFAGFTDDSGGARLFVEALGGRRHDLGPVASRLAFAWLPDGKSLVVAEAVVPGGTLFAGLNVVSVSDARRDPLYAGPVGAFFPSPDGRKIMLVAPDFDSGDWRWILVEIASRRAREVARFLPNPEFQMLLLHFDQYALSHRLWAPDSRHFVFASYPPTGEGAGSVAPLVSIVDTREGTARRIAEGRSAFWSPQ